jgi:hypothetical protein
MVFEREADRGQIAQGLVGPPEVVLHQPLSKVPVEAFGVYRTVPHGNEFILQGPVEPLVDRVVFGRFDP